MQYDIHIVFICSITYNVLEHQYLQQYNSTIIIEYALLNYIVKKSQPSLSSKVKEYTRKRAISGTAMPERYL